MSINLARFDVASIRRALLCADLGSLCAAARRAVLAMADLREFLAREGATPEPDTPEAFRAVIREEVARWTRLIRDANLTID